MYSPCDKYVNYIRFRQQQATQKLANSGMTTWAILAALVYIFWETIPLMPTLRPLLETKSVVLPALIGCSILSSIRDVFASMNNHSNPKSSYKIKSNNEWEARRELIMLALLMLPLLLCGPAWWHFERSIEFNIYFTNSALSLMVLFSITKNFIEEHKQKKITGLPTVESITGANEKTGIIASLFAYGLWFLLIYFNAVELISINHEFSKDIVKFIFNVVVIYALVIIFFENKTNNWELRYLEDLDRDLVLQDLTEDDVKIRVQSEYFGIQFGDWAKNMVSITSSLIAESRDLETEVNDEVLSINQIPDEYQHEKKARREKLSKRANEKLQEMETQVNSLHGWSCKLIAALNVNSSIYSDAKDLNQLSERNKNEAASLIVRIKRTIQDIPNNTTT